MFFWDHHKTITNCYEMLAKEVCDKYHLTQMEYNILMFLYNNPQHNTAADIVKIRKSTKSHVSTAIKELEKIVLLNKSFPIIEEGINTQKKFAKHILKGLSREEKDICLKVFDKICNNAEEYLKNR